MPFSGAWCKVWIYFGFVFAWTKGARPRFDTSTDMGLVLVPSDAEVDSVIFRLRATDQDADFPLVFEITATITPVVRIDNLPCTLYNKVCQANVILTKRLVAGRLHDFAVRVRDTKGDSNSMQATISVTNATTPRDKIFPHIPSLIMVPEVIIYQSKRNFLRLDCEINGGATLPQIYRCISTYDSLYDKSLRLWFPLHLCDSTDTKPGKELDYLLVRANSWSGKPVYIELWQPKELFTIRQRQTPTQTRGVITLIGELDFETQSVYTLTMYATDPYTEPGKDTRNIAGLNLVVIVQDVQDVPPIFTLAPPLTRINNSIQPGDIVIRVHAEDGDKGVPREIVYGLVSEGNPFTPFFNISETSGEIILARPLEELTQITHVGAPVVLTVVAEEIRRSRDEPPAQATVVDVGFLLGEPGNTPPYFESDKLVPETQFAIQINTNDSIILILNTYQVYATNRILTICYIATINENLEPGTVINFGEQYSTKVKDEDIGKAGVFALKLENNNGTFEINPTVAERTADFVIIVRDNTLIDYELHKTLSFKIIAQEVGPATNLSASVPAIIILRDINDNPPVFDEESYDVTLSENVTAGTRVVQVHATDIDTGTYGDVRYTSMTGEGSKAFTIDPETGLITVAMGYSLDREVAAKLELTVEARDENGNGNSGVVPLIVNLLDVNDNPPLFDKDVYEFMLNADLTNFTTPAVIKAIDADAEPPNNIVRYEIIHGNYENKFYLNETSGELILRSAITKIRRKKQSAYDKFVKKTEKKLIKNQERIPNNAMKVFMDVDSRNKTVPRVAKEVINEVIKRRRKRDNQDALYTLTARAYDLGIPHLSSVTQIRVISGIAMEARIMMFVVPGEQPNSIKTAETLATITGGRVTVLETRPYTQQNNTGSASTLAGGGKRSIIVARVEQTAPGTPLVDVEKIRETLAANGVGIIGGTDTVTTMNVSDTKVPVNGIPHTNNGQTITNNSIVSVHNEEVTVYKAENKLLLWLLIILGLLMLLAIAALIICCICPGCPFYMAPRKRRVHSSETLVARSDGRPKRHLHRQPAVAIDGSWKGRKQAWSADPTRRNWQFNKRNVKNCSLPGDVAYISGQPIDIQINHEAPRLRDATSYDHSRKSRIDEQERMYMEDVEGQKPRGYNLTEFDSLQRHDMDKSPDIQRQGYRQRFVEPDMNGELIREQHFYREGNAEVLRLVTRGQVEDTTASHHHHHHHCPTTLIVDGKDIILQRFIEDQKSRHELSMQDIEAARVMESHQRSKDIYQQQPPEIILVPDRLELGHRQHVEEIGPNVQRLVIDHGDYESPKIEKESQTGETLRPERQDDMVIGPMMADRPSVVTKEHVQINKPQYAYNDMELAKEKALLTRLLLKREIQHTEGGILDSGSYLETQSLPGQVAIATQTDRTAATQTDRHVRSRSDNDESDEDSRHRKKLKSRKKYGDGDWKRSRTLWMKSPIEEKSSPRFDKRLSILRKKAKEAKDDRKISLEPEVLREISDSLNGNGSSYKGEEEESMQARRKSTEQTTVSYKILNEKENGSSSSVELSKKKREKVFEGKSCEDDDLKMNGTESTSSPEIRVKNEKHSREKADDKSPKKEVKLKAQKKSDGVMKPSFRILEKEFTLFTKKLSKLSDKKCQESTGSDSTSQEKLESKESKKDTDSKKQPKKIDVSQRQATEFAQSTAKSEQKGKQKKETAIARTKQKLKYQQSHVMSTGSSEYDDTFDKTKKQSGTRQESKQKQPIGTQGHAKLKRQTHVDRRELKKQSSEFRNDDIEKRKDCPTKETLKTESKFEKTGRMVTRVSKLAHVSRKDNTTEETSTDTMANQPEGKAITPAPSGIEKRSSTDSSSTEFNGAHRSRKAVAEKAIERFSDDFVSQSKMESTGQSDYAEKGQNVKSVDEKETDGEKKSNTDVKVESIEDGVEDAKAIEKEEQVGTKRMTENSETLLHVAEQLIKSCVVPDIQRREETLIRASVEEDKKSGDEMTPPKSKSTTLEEPTQPKEENEQKTDGESIKESKEKDEDHRESTMRTPSPEKPSQRNEEELIDSGGVKLSIKDGIDREKDEVMRASPEKSKQYTEESEQLTDAGNVMKLNVKNGEDKVIPDGTKEVMAVMEDTSGNVTEKDEALESAESQIEKSENIEKEHKQKNEVSDDTSKQLEDKAKDLSEDTGEEETKERKLEVEKPAEAEKPTEAESNDKTELIQEIEQSVEDPETESLSIEKETPQENVAANLEPEKLMKDPESEHDDHLDTGETSHKEEETTGKIKSDEEADSLHKRKISDAAKENDDPKIDDSQTPDIEKGTENEKEGSTAKITSDEQVIEKEVDSPDKEKEISTVMIVDDNEISDKENISSDKEKILDEGVETIVITEIDDDHISEHEDILSVEKEKYIVDDTIDDSEINGKENMMLDADKVTDPEEGTVIEEITKHENISPDKGEEKIPDEGTEIIKKPSTTDDHQINEKENVIPSESSEPEEHLISEKKNDVPEMEHDASHEQDISETPDVIKDNLSEKKIDSSEIDKQFIQKDDVSPTDPASDDHDNKIETSPVKEAPDNQTSKEGIFSEMFKAFHSLADKFTGEKKSVNKSNETDAEGHELPPHSPDNVNKKEAFALPTDDTNKDQLETSNGNEPSSVKMDDQSSKDAEEKTSAESTEEQANKDTSIASADKQTVTSPKKIIEGDSKTDTVTEIKKESHEESGEGSEMSEEKPRTMEESDKSSGDKQSPVRPMLEKMGDQRDTLQDKKDVLQETTSKESTTADSELLGTSEKKNEPHEPAGEVSSNSHGIELFQTPPLTSETPTKEKFALDFIISETPTDSRKTSEPEKQVNSESEETKLQEAEQFVEKQTSASEKQQMQPFLGQQSREEDKFLISQDDTSRQDIINEKTDETLSSEEKGEANVEEQYADVSLPLFTNIIQSMDDLDDSDSSSDISRKTTLTTRPYQTPRHRARQSPEKESIDMQNMEDEEDTSLTIELMKDEDDRAFQETYDSNIEQPSPTTLIRTVEDEHTEFNKENETPLNIQMALRQQETLTDVVEEVIQEQRQLNPKTRLEYDEESSSSAKPTRSIKLQSQTKELDRPQGAEKSAVSKHARPESLKPGERKMKAAEKKRFPLQRKKKSSSEESSEEKAAHFHDQARHVRHQPRKKVVTDRSKQTDSNHAAQLRKTDGEQQRKQSTSKLKSEKDKKGSGSGEKNPTPPKTGDSKTQPKYMAWYKKNREEMEKRRAGLRAVDDESQLPRWLRRSMRNQKSDNEIKTPDQASANTTPRTRRKIKPLVNVESEQLKAIVRQGRKLRRAEGGKNEDPPIQIFASTPPTASAADTKHHLVQHSEYKYEKVPAPFYLHPPPAPHPSPQLSPEHFDVQSSMEHGHVDEDFDSGIAIPLQGGNRLRHQQLLEKKSVFDIAYSEAAPSQLRADSTTPPS
ncbi:titin homolog [Colletes gigas]|uniref:titin homolog n=1 Tax=Colletes gigas TaxID=935657 RepID=UPI001C9B5FA7|nr:titin homolog [Colletes gigas]